jgi:hypothetical protein
MSIIPLTLKEGSNHGPPISGPPKSIGSRSSVTYRASKGEKNPPA